MMQCGCMFIESTLAYKVKVVLQCVAVCCSVLQCVADWMYVYWVNNLQSRSNVAVTWGCCRFTEPTLIYKDQIVL